MQSSEEKIEDKVDIDIFRYLLIHCKSVDRYYQYDRVADSIDEIAAAEFLKLMAGGAAYDEVQDTYEIQFIVNEDRLKNLKRQFTAEINKNHGRA